MTSFTSLPSAAAVSWQSSGSGPPVSAQEARAHDMTTTSVPASPGSVQPLTGSGGVGNGSNASDATAGANATNAGAAKPLTPTPEQLGKIVSQLQSQIASSAADLQFSVDHDTGKSVVKVMDKTTNTVIWQFPSEQALQVSKDIARLQKGFIVNHQA